MTSRKIIIFYKKMFPVKDLNVELLNKLDDKSLGRMCQTNPTFKNICEDDKFWINRIYKIFGTDAEKILSIKPANQSVRDFYTGKEFASFKDKTYPWCKLFTKIPKMSQLVVDDFYNPQTGFINGSITRDIDGITYLLLKIVLQRSENKGEIEKLIEEFKERIPDYRWDDFSVDTTILTEVDVRTFRNIINVPVTRQQIFGLAVKFRPDVILALGKDKAGEIFKFVSFINKGFGSGELPLDIKWDELCTHPYLFSTLRY